MSSSQTNPGPWYLFSPGVDLFAFLGSGVFTVLGIAGAAYFGILDQWLPKWLWVVAMICLDGGHIFGTIFRVYLDPVELRRRPYLYGLTPLIAYFLGLLVIHFWGGLAYFRVIAYSAIYHFIRQQFGWVRLYRYRRAEKGRLGQWLDEAAIYAATLYPLLYLHVHPAHNVFWSTKQDIIHVPLPLAPFTVLYWLIMGAYVIKSVGTWCGLGTPNPGKDIVVSTTAFCWYLGYVTLYGYPFANTLTVVVLHAMPYYALTYYYTRHRREAGEPVGGALSQGLVPFLATHVVLAFLFTGAWDILASHHQTWLFRASWNLPWGILKFILPMLGVIQLTHYFLDAFIWRRRDNPGLQILGS